MCQSERCVEIVVPEADDVSLGTRQIEPLQGLLPPIVDQDIRRDDMFNLNVGDHTALTRYQSPVTTSSMGINENGGLAVADVLNPNILNDPVKFAIKMLFTSAGIDFPKAALSNKALKRHLIDRVLEKYDITQDETLMPLGRLKVRASKPGNIEKVKKQARKIAKVLRNRKDKCNIRAVLDRQKVTHNPFIIAVDPDQLELAVQEDGIHMSAFDSEDNRVASAVELDIFPRPMHGLEIGPVASEGGIWKSVLCTGAFNLLLTGISSHNGKPGEQHLQTTLCGSNHDLSFIVDIVFNGEAGRALDKPDQAVPHYAGPIKMTYSDQDLAPEFLWRGMPNDQRGHKLEVVGNTDHSGIISHGGTLPIDNLTRYILNQFAGEYSDVVKHLYGAMLDTLSAPKVHMLQVLFRTDPISGEVSFCLHDIDGVDTTVSWQKSDCPEHESFAAQNRLFKSQTQNIIASWRIPTAVKNDSGEKNMIEAVLIDIIPQGYNTVERRRLARSLETYIAAHIYRKTSVALPEGGLHKMFKPDTTVAVALARYCRNLGIIGENKGRSRQNGNNGQIALDFIKSRNNNHTLLHLTIDGLDLAFLMDGKNIRKLDWNKRLPELDTKPEKDVYLEPFNPVTHRAFLSQVAAMFGKEAVPVQYLHLREGE